MLSGPSGNPVPDPSLEPADANPSGRSGLHGSNPSPAENRCPWLALLDQVQARAENLGFIAIMTEAQAGEPTPSTAAAG